MFEALHSTLLKRSIVLEIPQTTQSKRIKVFGVLHLTHLKRSFIPKTYLYLIREQIRSLRSHLLVRFPCCLNCGVVTVRTFTNGATLRKVASLGSVRSHSVATRRLSRPIVVTVLAWLQELNLECIYTVRTNTLWTLNSSFGSFGWYVTSLTCSMTE